MKRILPVLLCLFLLALPLRADTFKDSQHAFSLDIPEGWTPMTPADVQAAVRTVSPDPDLQAFAGFEHGNEGLVILSASPYPDDATYSSLTQLQIQNLAAAVTQASIGEFHTATRPVIGNMGTGAIRQITCCSEPPGFIIDLNDPKRQVRSRTIAYLGHDHAVFLHFFMKPDDYPFVERTMNEMAASFHFNASQALALKTTFTAKGDYTTYGIYFFVGLLILAAAGVVYYLFKPKAY